MRVATAAYEMDQCEAWSDYESKMTDWVRRGAGADLLVFPEYAAMELACLDGEAAAWDLQGCIDAVGQHLEAADALFAKLAAEFGVYILAGSAPVSCAEVSGKPVNRARFFAPDGSRAHQDKQIMTCWERDPWGIHSGGPLRLFDTALGRIGVLICYDCEFPLLARALGDVDILLVPSCTEAEAGYWRVRIGAMARALENQCVAVMASTVGACPWSQVVDQNTGAGGVYGPPDLGFPSNGIIAQGALNAPGWTFADIDLAAIQTVREEGAVRGRAHWNEQLGRDREVTIVSLGPQKP